jgi:hypothetical protein
MHLLPSVTMQPNLELKTRPKQLLGSLPLVIALPALALYVTKFRTLNAVSLVMLLTIIYQLSNDHLTII